MLKCNKAIRKFKGAYITTHRSMSHEFKNIHLVTNYIEFLKMIFIYKSLIYLLNEKTCIVSFSFHSEAGFNHDITSRLFSRAKQNHTRINLTDLVN